MIQVEPLQQSHLPQVQELINNHLSAMVPGWALPEAFIESRLHLAGCDRIDLAVAAADEAAGAGRFYQRFGWEVFVREQNGWEWAAAPVQP